MNYVINGIFTIKLEAEDSEEAKQKVRKMFKAYSKLRHCIIEINEEEGRCPDETKTPGAESKQDL